MNLFGKALQCLDRAHARRDLREFHLEEVVFLDGLDIRKLRIFLDGGDLLLEVVIVPYAVAVVGNDDVLGICSDHAFPCRRRP